MQDNDPHHLHPSEWEPYIFLIAAPILVALVFYFGVKLLTYLENRSNRRRDLRNKEGG